MDYNSYQSGDGDRQGDGQFYGQEDGNGSPDQKKKKRGWPGFFASAAVGFVMAFVLAVVFEMILTLSQGGKDEMGLAKLDRLRSMVNQYYLYVDEVDEDALQEGIYSGYIDALGDIYTEYYDREQTQKIMESTMGEFYGIGVVVTYSTQTGQILILKVYEDSPAWKAGMKDGDIIWAVNGESVEGQSLDEVVSKIKGEKGTAVDITVLRDGSEVNMEVIRDKVQEHTVEYEMKDGNVGYIQVGSFSEVTYDQFRKAMDDLEGRGMERLIIDLRGNPGGILDTVADMLKLMLPKGVIVSTRYRDGTSTEIMCDGSNVFTKPLVVLVNENSASAAEIFSGAIQDYGVGKIVGVRTFGKGVVQSIFDLGDGSSLKITTSEYFLPSGRSINGQGVEPDVEVKLERDKENPDRDNQLEKAMEIVESMK